ncbi:TrmB family transcriptional regulator [Saliphagus infecundisoli]|uniref:TrmB family transcriptional regulator n=1 Tax=Saliphagus infecundisoli TaxID=1849069 RepID=A0ABD5QBP6_9EURY|nr:TrmB family transcriptional regulator sugar-binding domain-containing protein [Saliphagus infecundisoli]
MNGDELRATLEEAGLSPYQADAYVTLLERGSASATDVATSSSVPDPRIYDVLRDLEQRGYAETYDEGSLHARAHDLATVLEDLRSRATRFETAAEEIEERWDRPDLEDNDVSIVTRFETVLARAESLIRSADNQVQIGLARGEYERLSPVLSAAVEDGVDVKLCLYGDWGTLPREELSAVCTEARHRAIPSPFVALIDRTWTCFSPPADSTNEYGIVVDDRSHAYVFHWYFLTCLWEVQETIYSASDGGLPATYVDVRQCIRRIEPLLESGRRVEATVTGLAVGTGEPVEHRGVVTDVTYAGPSGATEGMPPLSALAGRAYLTMDAGGDTYTVGGWGATLEDVEAERVTVELAEGGD